MLPKLCRRLGLDFIDHAERHARLGAFPLLSPGFITRTSPPVIESTVSGEAVVLRREWWLPAPGAVVRGAFLQAGRPVKSVNSRVASNIALERAGDYNLSSIKVSFHA